MITFLGSSKQIFDLFDPFDLTNVRPLRPVIGSGYPEVEEKVEEKLKNLRPEIDFGRNS